MHFGHQVTSRVESGHSVLKRYLQVSTGDLKKVVDSITLLLTSQLAESRAALAIAKDKTPVTILTNPLFAEVA